MRKLVDLTVRTSNRKKKLQKTWAGKLWKEKRLEFIGDRGCSWCGSKEYLTVHHPYRNSYGSELYMDFYLSQCVVLCRRCHSALHAGKVLCECREHYRPFDAQECFVCYASKYPEVLEKVEIDKIKKKKADKLYRHNKYLEAKARCTGKGKITGSYPKKGVKSRGTGEVKSDTNVSNSGVKSDRSGME